MDQVDDDAATLVVSDDVVNTVINSGASETRRFYFWDGCASCFEAADGWELCDGGASVVGDCAKDNDSPHNFESYTGDWDDHADIRIRFIEVELALDADFELGFTPSAVVNNNASITPPTGNPSYLNARRPSNLLPSLTDIVIDDGADSTVAAVEFGRFDIRCEQDDFVGSNYNVFELSNDDGNSYDCTSDFLLTLASSPTYLQFNVTIDYFPELPLWVRDNNWNDSILLAYAPDHAPGAGGAAQQPGGAGGQRRRQLLARDLAERARNQGPPGGQHHRRLRLLGARPPRLHRQPGADRAGLG